MSLKYALLATEGPHDQAVIGRLLELLGLKKFNGKLEALDRWICEQTVKDIPEIAALKQFIENLLELPMRDPVAAPQTGF